MQFVSRATGARVGGIVEEPSESQRKPDPAQAQSIRTRFLEELLADEEHGRLRPVEDYVARYGEVADFVRTEHDALLHRDAQDAVEDSPVLRPDECVGRYVLRQRLGEGGMGTVFEAFDPDVGRRVVVKTLRWKTNAGDPAQERLRREARVLGRLAHPALAKVLDVVEEVGRVHIVLPYHDGRTLAAHLEDARAVGSGDGIQTQWPILVSAAHERAAALRALLQYFIRVAEALHAAHKAGVVHRDLKPHNLLVQPDGTPIVLDFGLALPDGDDRLTQQGEIMGTPLYMAPEQIEGGEVDVRADVYALGVTLYEALTLVQPFAGSGGRAATFQRVLRGDPVPLRRHQPLIPRDLEAVVLKAMEREPARRYADAPALAKELQRVIDLEPTDARPVSGVTLWMRRVQRRPRAAAVVGLVIALACWAGWSEWKGAKDAESWRVMACVDEWLMDGMDEFAGRPDSVRSAARAFLKECDYDKKKVRARRDKQALRSADGANGVFTPILEPRGLVLDARFLKFHLPTTKVRRPNLDGDGVEDLRVQRDYRVTLRDASGNVLFERSVIQRAEDDSSTLREIELSHFLAPGQKYEVVIELVRSSFVDQPAVAEPDLTQVRDVAKQVFQLADEAMQSEFRAPVPSDPEAVLARATRMLASGLAQDALLLLDLLRSIADVDQRHVADLQRWAAMLLDDEHPARGAQALVPIRAEGK